MRDQPATPLSVLTSNDGQDESWSPRFNQAVIDAARAQILADFRIHPAFAGPLNSLITIAAGAAIAVTAHV
ncbi:MAG TPA: hypothetical protein VGX23_27080 [Actinocrinis sp.]|nr:hypothetical protein [Actinocrinis sp.]